MSKRRPVYSGSHRRKWAKGQHTTPTAVNITDSFTRADGPLGSTDTGQTWSVISGTWNIVSNEAVASGSGNQIAVVDAGISDATISVNISSGGNGVGIAFRVVDSSNYWFLSMRNDGFSQLVKIVAGSSTSLGGIGAGSYVDGAEIKVVLSGDSIALFYNGTAGNTFTDADLKTATKHGLFASFGGTWQDNFSITG